MHLIAGWTTTGIFIKVQVAFQETPAVFAVSIYTNRVVPGITAFVIGARRTLTAHICNSNANSSWTAFRFI